MKRLTIILLLYNIAGINAQVTSPEDVVIDTITIEGNKKTRDKTILRELRFKVGDQIPINQLSALLTESELLIMNTGLFTKAKISFENWVGATNRIQLKIEVLENWYFFPVPVFELADRNFNVWWVENNRSLERVNFGLELAHLNLSGMNDRLKMSVKYGYTRNFTVSYKLPTINKQQTLGFNSYLSYSRNREVNYATLHNRQEFYRDDNRFIYEKFRSELALIYRPKLRQYHDVMLGYSQEKVSEPIVNEFNRFFFSNQKQLQRFFTLGYRYTSDQTDFRPYPLNGYRFKGLVEKSGLGVFNDRDALILTAAYDKYSAISENWYLSLRSKVKFSAIRSRQSYKYNRGLGFSGDYLRGFEYYVIDGQDMAYLRSSVKLRLLEKEYNLGRLMPLNSYRILPTKVFFSINNDVGYVNSLFTENPNPMNNRLLWGGGIGLDFIFYYDKVLQIQYSFNDLLENGLFLHLDLNF